MWITIYHAYSVNSLLVIANMQFISDWHSPGKNNCTEPNHTHNAVDTNIIGTTARLGRVTPLARPWSLYKSDAERRFLEFWVQMARSRSMTPFSIPAERIPRCIFGANLVIPAQNHYKLLRGITRCLWILNQNGQNDLEVSGSVTPIFNTSPDCPRVYVWCTFVDSSPNLWPVFKRTSRIS